MGASLAVHHHLPHDEKEYGASEETGDLLTELRQSLRGRARLVEMPGDLGDRGDC